MIQMLHNTVFLLSWDRPWQLYRVESIRLPGYPVTAAVIRTAIKETHGIERYCGAPKSRKPLSAHLPAASDQCFEAAGIQVVISLQHSYVTN
jgi:hypothetical protein